MRFTIFNCLSLMLALILFAGCSNNTAIPTVSTLPVNSISPNEASAAPESSPSSTKPKEAATNSSSPIPTKEAASDNSNNSTVEEPSLSMIAEPESITVLVNKQFALPQDYEPSDLVYPNLLFTFTEKSDRRKMRTVAARALESLFAAASKDKVQLAGVSAYRSYTTQKAVFNRYVKQDGLKKARTYSAIPGTSEHETGLAIDVSGSNGKCAAEDCFAGSKEAIWLGKHVAEYGFIIRYPQGKAKITGYNYEPWHLRYVGTEVSLEIAKKGITLEEYLNAVPVSK
jgi:D-alanyl-D-alanine carboxypeptidase